MTRIEPFNNHPHTHTITIYMYMYTLPAATHVLTCIVTLALVTSSVSDKLNLITSGADNWTIPFLLTGPVKATGESVGTREGVREYSNSI